MTDLYFASDEHRCFFHAMLRQVRNPDVYHQALFYLLGASPDTRANCHRLYDAKEDVIKPEGLDEGWQTGSTRRLSRLALNLWNGYAQEGSEKMATPYELFDCSFAPYMMRAIRLRYPEYCVEPSHPGTRHPPEARADALANLNVKKTGQISLKR